MILTRQIMAKIQLPKMLKKLHLNLLLLCSLIGFGSYAQTYPIAVNTQITQPSPIYLSNYADATTINSPIKVQLVLNDLTISNRQVKLKIYFQGNGISFTTNDFVVGARPLYLEGGFPLQLTNVDLAPYFEYQNLLGLNQNQYAQPLPEGVYNIYVEVYDFATGKKLSKKTGATTIIFQNEPPFLNLPLNNASIMQQNIQNIIFSWTPRSINVSNVEYEFSLVEIWDQYTPVQNAFAYSPPLYTTTIKNTTFQYGINEPQLIPGKKYAWRIKAKAILGAEEIGVFKNNGYSEIYSFTYEVFCTSPLAIKTDGISQDQAKISWSGTIDNYDYQVNYREKNADSEWYKLITPRENLTISNLKPNTVYEYTVGASCDVGKYTHSFVKEFTTLAKDEITFQGCGIKPDPNDLANKTPLPQLFPNDVVTAGDFPIVVLHSTGNNGTFTGDGYVTLPFLEKFRKLIDAADALGGEKINIGQFSRIRITFNNIGVNTDFKLISGEIVASYDPNWKNMADLDGVVNDAFGDAGNVVHHQYDLSIKSVVKNPDGSITVTSTTGVTSVLEKTVNDIVITDKDGKQFAVPANAPATDIKQTGQLAPGGIPTSKNTNGMGSGGDVAEISSPDVSVIFSKGDGKYAFDTAPTAENGSLTKTYQTIPKKGGGTYKVNYKAISDNPNTDVVVATVDFKNGKTKKDLVFKTQNGTAIDSTQIAWKDNVATLTLKKTLDFAKETIIATVKPATPKDPKEAAGKYDIAGTIDLWHLTNKKVNVTLVSVNNAKIPSNAQSQLNAIYEPAGVTFNVNTVNVTLDNTWGESIETSESGLLATYTDEQQLITTNLKQKLGSDYKNDTYYIIYTDTPASKSNILGFMPLKRQYGFIFNKTNIVRTLAHELGHGVFGLQHPFTEYNTSTTTDLLMDYGTGVTLSHNDWQVLHAPGLQLYPFIQGDEAGELAGLVVKSTLSQVDYQNAAIFKFFTDQVTGINEFYYRGYKITFSQKGAKITFDNKNNLFTINENNKNTELKILTDKNTNLNPELFYNSELKKIPGKDDYTVSNLKKYSAYYSKELYKIEKYVGTLPAADLANLNSKLKNLDPVQSKKIITLIESLPLNEVLEICPSNSQCYDIFGKEYSAAEWDKIIQLLENKKNSLGASLTRLAVKDQLIAIKKLLDSEQNLDKICRLILNNVRSANKSLEYPESFKIEYLGNSLGTDTFRVELLEKLRIENVEKVFLISCTANQDITNNENIEFQLSLNTSEEKLTTKIRKGTSAAEALSNLIGKSVLVASIAIPTMYVAAEYYLSAEAYTLYLEYLSVQNKQCLTNLSIDIALQIIINDLVTNYNGIGVPFSYTSPLVSCGTAYLSKIGLKEACATGALVSLGDTALNNFKEGKLKTFPATIEEAALLCVVSATLHNIVSAGYISAVKESVQWYYIKNLINKALNNSQKAIVAKFMVNNESKILNVVLSKIINSSKDDISINLKKLEEYLLKEYKITEVNKEIIVSDKNGTTIAKFIDGNFANVTNNLDILIAKLTSSIKSTYDNLIKNGITAVEEGNVIKFIDNKNGEIAKIIDGEFIPQKWLGTYKNVIVSKTESGYWLIKNGDVFGIEIGYKNGREFTAEFVNKYHTEIGHHAPYKQLTKVFERDLLAGEKVYIVEYKNAGIPNPGGWGSKNKITSVKELREELAVLNDWKDIGKDELVLREYTVIKPFPVRDGVVAPLQEISGSNAGQVYAGNQHQYEFIENVRGEDWKKYLKISDEKGTLLISELDFSKFDIPEALKHIKFRDLSNSTLREIKGLHDATEFYKLRVAKAIDNLDFNFPIGKTLDEVEDIVILKQSAHSKVPGVTIIEYRVPTTDGKYTVKIDGKDVNKGFTTGATKGESSIKNYVKTIYDPKIWTDSKLEKALKEALQDCNNKGNMIEDKLTSGITKDGYEIEFIIRDQKVKTFYFK